MKTKIILFMIVSLVWLGLTWSVDVPSLIVGLATVLLVVFLISDMFAPHIRILKQPVRYFWILYYVPFFTWECIKANFDVAFRVGHPMTPINPGIVKVKTRLKTDLALTFLGNSITLTPGTLTVDTDKENECLYVHWINVKDKETEEATRKIVGRFEPLLRRIFE
jgi:multicomponent Na+:H+ antiporter subunit E